VVLVVLVKTLIQLGFQQLALVSVVTLLVAVAEQFLLVIQALMVQAELVVVEQLQQQETVHLELLTLVAVVAVAVMHLAQLKQVVQVVLV
jgi:hypothetical protein